MQKRSEQDLHLSEVPCISVIIGILCLTLVCLKYPANPQITSEYHYFCWTVSYTEETLVSQWLTVLAVGIFMGGQ